MSHSPNELGVKNLAESDGFMNLKNKLRDVVSRTPKSWHAIITRFMIRSLMRGIMSEEDVIACERNRELIPSVLNRHLASVNPKHAEAVSRRIDAIVGGSQEMKLNASNLDIPIKEDIAFCHYAYGMRLEEYVFMSLSSRNREAKQRREIVSDLEQHIMRVCCNDVTHAELSDKARAYDHLKDYYQRDMMLVDSKTTLGALDRFLSDHDQVVLKRVLSSRGAGIEFLNAVTVLDMYKNGTFRREKCLLEECIEQSDEVRCFNPDSVNTARVVTLFTREGIRVPWGFFRTGRKGSRIDNCATGGIYAAIDTKNGTVCSDGCDEFGNRFQVHPDSAIEMKGFVLPEWTEALALCKQAARVTPDLKYLSWDLAHSSKHGWMIVEVNTCGQFMWQSATLSGVKHELKELLELMDLVTPYRLVRDIT